MVRLLITGESEGRWALCSSETVPAGLFFPHWRREMPRNNTFFVLTQGSSEEYKIQNRPESSRQTVPHRKEKCG